jgi:DNA helicase-2/ATP-dependent DNA helicase PcrA
VSISQPFRSVTAGADIGAAAAPAALKLGQQVRHRKFGEGVILNYEGQGGSARVQVNFAHAGTKWLVVSYANLESIGA